MPNDIERRVRVLEQAEAARAAREDAYSDRDDSVRQWAPVIVAIVAIIVSSLWQWLAAGGAP